MEFYFLRIYLITVLADCFVAEATTDKITGVMKQYMEKTCLQFVNVTGKTSSVKTYLNIQKLSGFVYFCG